MTKQGDDNPDECNLVTRISYASDSFAHSWVDRAIFGAVTVRPEVFSTSLTPGHTPTLFLCVLCCMRPTHPRIAVFYYFLCTSSASHAGAPTLVSFLANIFVNFPHNRVVLDLYCTLAVQHPLGEFFFIHSYLSTDYK